MPWSVLSSTTGFKIPAILFLCMTKWSMILLVVRTPTRASNQLWESFQSDKEIDEDFVGAVREIVFAVQNTAYIVDIAKNGGLSNFLKDNKVLEKTQNLKYLHQKAVREAWKEGKELIEKTGRGTRDWTKKEVKQLKQTGKVKGYEGHQINSVAQHPEHAGDPNNVEFLKGRSEHLEKHNRNFKTPTSGTFIDRKKIIEDFLKKQ